jgi:hypothetical protein
MTTIPRSVVNARRTAGGILVLSALGTVIVLIMLAARWSTQPPFVSGAMGTLSSTPAVAALVAGHAHHHSSQQLKEWIHGS